MASMVSITFYNEQLGIEFFKDKMTGNLKKIVLIIIDILTLLFILSMFLSSAKLSKTVWYSKVGTWRMPQPFLYFPMVLSYGLSFLMVLTSKLKNANKLNQKKRKE
jgi:TRAP-type C4-dicarboxylate transport system permease small subunit